MHYKFKGCFCFSHIAQLTRIFWSLGALVLLFIIKKNINRFIFVNSKVHTILNELHTLLIFDLLIHENWIIHQSITHLNNYLHWFTTTNIAFLFNIADFQFNHCIATIYMYVTRTNTKKMCDHKSFALQIWHIPIQSHFICLKALVFDPYGKRSLRGIYIYACVYVFVHMHHFAVVAKCRSSSCGKVHRRVIAPFCFWYVAAVTFFWGYTFDKYVRHTSKTPVRPS